MATTGTEANVVREASVFDKNTVAMRTGGEVIGFNRNRVEGD